MTERINQEQALLETKQFLETTLNSLEEAVFVVEPDERVIVLCNAAVELVFGYTPDELIGRSTDILHVDRASYERFGQLGEPILNRDEPFHVEYEMKRKDGAVIYTEITVTAISEESGWSTGVVSVVRDITDRKRVERQVQELNEHLQAVFRSSPVAIIALDVEDKVTLWSPAAEDLFGWKQEEVLEEPYPIVPDDGYAESEANRRQVLAGETVTGLEFRRQHKDGTLIDVSLSSAPLRDQNGEIIGIMTLLQDITERKQAQQQLQALNEQLEAVFHSSPVAIIAFDVEDKVTLWSPAAEEIFGWKQKEVLGRPLPIVPEDDYDTFASNRDYVLRGNSDTDIELRRQHKDGTLVDVSAAKAPLRSPAGDITGIIAIYQDITTRKEAEAALERQTRRLEIVHQIDTAVLSADSPYNIAKNALVQIRQLLHCWRASLILYNNDREQSEVLAVSAEGETSITAGMTVPGDSLWDVDSLRRGEIYIKKGPTATDRRSLMLRRLVEEGLASYASVPLIVHGDLIGALNLAYDYRTGVDTLDREVAREIANQLAIAIHQASLREQLHALAGYLQDAREEERARLARDIHDDLGQALTALKFDISRLQRALPEDASELHEQADQMSASVESAIWMVRRVSSDLRPSILDDLGLIVAIEWHVNEFSRRTGIAFTTDLNIDESLLPEKLSTALFRIYQEALTNVARHAQASRVHVSLHEQSDAVVLVVRDNGKGITERHISNPDSLGLRGMRERARPWNGCITFEGEPDAGTTVTVRIPIEQLGRDGV